MYSSSFSILALTETWLLNNIYDKEIIPNGFTIFRSDRASRGGGVLICTSHNTPSRLVKSHESIDMVTIEILTSPNIFIWCVYVPPGCSVPYFQSVLQALDDLACLGVRLIVLGDFNLSDINWQCLSSSTHFSNLFCNLVFQHNLSQLIHVPTHIKGNTLDLLLTNIDNHISNVLIISVLHLTTSLFLLVWTPLVTHINSSAGMFLTSVRLILMASMIIFWNPHFLCMMIILHVMTSGSASRITFCQLAHFLSQKLNSRLFNLLNGSTC